MTNNHTGSVQSSVVPLGTTPSECMAHIDDKLDEVTELAKHIFEIGKDKTLALEVIHDLLTKARDDINLEWSKTVN